MLRRLPVTLLALCLLPTGCGPRPAPAGDGADTTGGAEAAAGLDSLNARIASAYRTHDPGAYAAQFTDSAVFEWPAFDDVRGSAALEEMARSNWAPLRDMELRLDVAARRFAADHATEFGAFEQAWSDSAGTRWTEFGRYASVLARQPDGSWRMDRFLGFEDSTRRVSPTRP